MDWAGRRSREFAGRHSREFAGRRSRECRRVIILIRAVAGHHLRLVGIIFAIVRFLGRQAKQLVGEDVVKQKGKKVPKTKTIQMKVALEI